MQVFERIGRMMRADAHGVMDQLEERSLVLRQHLREAEIEVAHKRAKLEALDEERRRVREEGKRLESQVAALDEDVELAMSGEDPDLARFAVRRLLPKREALKELFVRAAQLDERRDRLFERLQTQEGQLGDLRAKVRASLARPQSDIPGCGDTNFVTEEEIELELLRRRSSRLGNGSVGEKQGHDERRSSGASASLGLGTSGTKGVGEDAGEEDR